MRLYEIHRLRVEDTQDASSVTGHVRGMLVDGTGHISGRTDTLPTANLFANRCALGRVVPPRHLDPGQYSQHLSLERGAKIRPDRLESREAHHPLFRRLPQDSASMRRARQVR